MAVRRVTQTVTYPDQYRDADNRLMDRAREVRRPRRYAIHIGRQVEYRDFHTDREAMAYVESKTTLRKGWDGEWQTDPDSDWIGFYILRNPRGKPQRGTWPIGIRYASRLEG